MIEQAKFYPFLQEKLWTNKQKLPKIKEKKQVEGLKNLKSEEDQQNLTSI